MMQLKNRWLKSMIVFCVTAIVCSQAALASAPTLRAPWNDGEKWQPSTYDGHAGGTRTSVDFNAVSSVSDTWPYGTETNDAGRNIRAAHAGTVTLVSTANSGGMAT